MHWKGGLDRFWHLLRLKGLFGGRWPFERIGGLRLDWGMLDGQRCCCLAREFEQDCDDLNLVQL